MFRLINALAFPFTMLFVLGFIILSFVVWLWALIDCIKSRLSTEEKIIWIIVILFFHFIGAILYFLLKGKIKMGNTKNKTLFRKIDDRMLGGVCAGVAQHLDLDVSLVRLLWVIITIFTGIWPGVLVYIIAWAVIPEEPKNKPTNKTKQHDKQSKEPVQGKTKTKKKAKK
ncbi:MAG: PspC domain-containing protein [Candidatus Nanoarchaeia archaeon]